MSVGTGVVGVDPCQLTRRLRRSVAFVMDHRVTTPLSLGLHQVARNHMYLRDTWCRGGSAPTWCRGSLCSYVLYVRNAGPVTRHVVAPKRPSAFGILGPRAFPCATAFESIIFWAKSVYCHTCGLRPTVRVAAVAVAAAAVVAAVAAAAAAAVCSLPEAAVACRLFQ